MFLIAAITGLLIAIAIGAFIYGTIQLSTYAFRISTGRGIAVLLLPPYTLYFAFAELDQEEKALPTASWVFGISVTALLMAIFWQPITLLATGQTDKLVAKSPGEVAAEEHGSSSDNSSEDSEKATSEASDDQDDSGDEASTDGDDGDEAAEKEGDNGSGGDDESADEDSDDGSEGGEEESSEGDEKESD